jgi:hypothetical protein
MKNILLVTIIIAVLFGSCASAGMNISTDKPVLKEIAFAGNEYIAEIYVTWNEALDHIMRTGVIRGDTCIDNMGNPHMTYYWTLDGNKLRHESNQLFYEDIFIGNFRPYGSGFIVAASGTIKKTGFLEIVVSGTLGHAEGNSWHVAPYYIFKRVR